MSDNVYQQFADAQKAMFDQWNKAAASMFGQGGEAGKLFADPAVFYEKMQEAPNEFWKKAAAGYKSYQAVFELWKTLGEQPGGLNSAAFVDLYDAWVKQHFVCIKENLTPEMPAFARSFMGKLVETMEANQDVWSDQARTWLATAQSMQNAWLDSLTTGPDGFLEFLGAWQKGYDESFGKLMDAPTFGKEMEFWKRQKDGFDHFIRYNVAATKFHVAMYDIAQDATKEVVENFFTLRGEGNEPKTFEDFYKYWSRSVSAAYQKILFSDEMSRLAGNMVDEMSRFKIAYDKLCEAYLTNFPVVLKSDMDDLNKTVYSLTKEVRALKKELRANDKRG